MTVVVTINVEGRYRGFLASVMLEIAPGGIHLAADDQWDTGTGVGRVDPLVRLSGAGVDRDDVARPQRRGRTTHTLLGRASQGA